MDDHQNISVRLRMRIKEGMHRGICSTCRWAQISEDDMGVTVICEDVHPWRNVQRPLLQCSGYSPMSRMTKHEMEDVAWTINTKDRKSAGFIQPPKKKDL
jgi:hypothetical protein